MRKQTKKHFFSHRSENDGIVSLLFPFNSLQSENDGSFSLPFRFISLRSENDGSFSLPFCFISLRSENDGSFSLLFRFVFASFHFCLASDFFVSHWCEISEKNFASVSLHFASKRKWRRTLVLNLSYLLRGSCTGTANLLEPTKRTASVPEVPELPKYYVFQNSRNPWTPYDPASESTQLLEPSKCPASYPAEILFLWKSWNLLKLCFWSKNSLNRLNDLL